MNTLIQNTGINPKKSISIKDLIQFFQWFETLTKMESWIWCQWWTCWHHDKR